MLGLTDNQANRMLLWILRHLPLNSSWQDQIFTQFSGENKVWKDKEENDDRWEGKTKAWLGWRAGKDKVWGDKF